MSQKEPRGCAAWLQDKSSSGHVRGLNIPSDFPQTLIPGASEGHQFALLSVGGLGCCKASVVVRQFLALPQAGHSGSDASELLKARRFINLLAWKAL